MSPAPHETPDVFLVSADGGGGLSREQARGAGFVSTSRGVRVRRHLLDDPDVRARAPRGCQLNGTCRTVAPGKSVRVVGPVLFTR